MRYQVVVLDSEIGSDMEITSISWQKHPAGDDSSEFQDVKIYMGLCSGDQLGSTFDDNYIPGTRTLVFQASTQVMDAATDQWDTLTLDSPYSYDSSQGNLVVEVTWATCVNHQSFYVYSWDTGSIRAVGYTQTGAPTHATGSLSSAIPRIMLTGSSSGALTSLTFGEIKTEAGAI
jgi:hypothetical protein